MTDEQLREQVARQRCYLCESNGDTSCRRHQCAMSLSWAAYIINMVAPELKRLQDEVKELHSRYHEFGFGKCLDK